jgi:hypothetical protein
MTDVGNVENPLHLQQLLSKALPTKVGRVSGADTIAVLGPGGAAEQRSSADDG